VDGDKELEEKIKEKVRSIPDYPKKGVLFRDYNATSSRWASF